MATVRLTPTALAVRLTCGERIGGLLRDIEVPRTAVRGVDVVDEPLAGLRGLRLGLSLPGVRKVGTWRRRWERTDVSVRRGQPAIRLRLSGQRYDALLIGADDAARLAAHLSPAG